MDVTDIPDLLIPFGLAVAAIVCWKLSRRIKSRGVRLTARISSLIVAIGSALLTCIFFVFTCFDWTDFNLPAPDGKHVAKLRFVTPGAVGRDMAVVLLRRRWSTTWERIYFGPGTKDAYGQDAEIHWQDSEHLLVRYHAIGVSSAEEMKRLEESPCPTESIGVKIVCESY